MACKLQLLAQIKNTKSWSRWSENYDCQSELLSFRTFGIFAIASANIALQIKNCSLQYNVIIFVQVYMIKRKYKIEIYLFKTIYNYLTYFRFLFKSKRSKTKLNSLPHLISENNYTVQGSGRRGVATCPSRPRIVIRVIYEYCYTQISQTRAKDTRPCVHALMNLRS